MKKRIVSLLLCVSMLLALSVSAFAAGSASLTVASVTAAAGETVAIDVSIANNPGIAGAKFIVSYDRALTLTNVAAGSALSGLTFTKPGKMTDNPVNLFWDGMDADTSNGTIATLTFTVSASAAEGTHPITVTYNASDVFDGDLNNVRVSVTNGGVTVPSSHEHSYVPTATTAPTCTTAGSCTYSCTCGDSYTETIPALGHSFTNYVSDGNATCKDDGTKTAKCDRCDATDTVTDAGSHRKVAHTSSGETDCAKADVCTVCGTTIRAAGAHSWDKGTETAAPTCTEAGVMTHTCTVCGATMTENIAALGHSFTNYASDGNATCKDDGTKTAKCDRCDATDTVTDTGSHRKVAHTSSGETDCTKADVCTVCGTTIRAAGAHSWDKGTETAAPTCTEAGVMTHTCTVCGATKTETIPALGHDWDDGIVTLAPTETAPGVKTYTCLHDATHTRTEEIPPIPAAPTLTVVGGEAKAGETVTAQLVIANNSGIAGARFTVTYDSALTLTNVAAGSAFSSLAFTKPGDLTANPITLFWDGMDDDTTNGTIATLTFTVGETATEGEHPITVTYRRSEVYDGELNNVELSTINGAVTVTPQEIVKNGIILEDGAYYYYVDGVRTHAGLVYVDGYYYYIKSDCTAVTNVTRYVDANHNNGLLPAGNYTFGADGKLEFVIRNGIVLEDGVYYYYVDDVRTHAGLIQIGDDYYYVKSGGVVETNNTRTIDENHTNGLLPAGSYTFGADGKLLWIKNGIYEEDGKLYYYVNNVRTHAGLIRLGDDYYYVKTGGVVETNTTRNIDINHTNGLLPVGSYEIGSDGKLIVVKNGIFYEDGTYYYYQNDVKTHAGLFKYYDGYYYYAKTGGVLATDTTRYVDQLHSNGYPYGTYTFGADGKAETKDGVVEEDGGLYYYVNGKRTHAGLIQIGSYIYYVKTSGEVVTSTKRYVDELHSNGRPAGYYTFDAEGRAEIKSGVIYENGAYYYYVQGAMSHAGLVLVDGYYYYIKSDCTAVTNTTRYVDVNHNNGLLPAGNYTFGADGKMQPPKNGIYYEDGAYYYYVNNARTHAGLVLVDGYYYYIKSNCTAVTNITRSIDENHANGLLPAGTYTFGADGKMILE